MKCWSKLIYFIIGKGTYATVYQVIHKLDHQIYALKMIPITDSTTAREKENALAEIRFLASV